MKKRLVIALIMLVLLSTYTPQKLTLSSIFTIKEIKINNNSLIEQFGMKPYKLRVKEKYMSKRQLNHFKNSLFCVLKLKYKFIYYVIFKYNN